MNKIIAPNIRIFDIGAIIIIILLVIARFPSLHIPYFWDELGVYAPGALHMKDAGTIGIMPADLDPLYSRGHPLLFYFCAAGFYKIFGDSVAIGHSFAIMTACITLIIFYLFTKRIFDRKIAVISLALLAVQPIFFTMSGVLFPEMMFTLFTIICLNGIIRSKWWLYAFGASLAIMVKEPGLVLPATGIIILFIESLKNKDFFTLGRWKLFFIGSIPLFVYAIFLLIQKAQHGWYFFPYHVELIKLTPDSIYYHSKHFFTELLVDQGRWLLSLSLIIFLLIKKAWRNDDSFKRILLTSGIFLLFTLLFFGFNYYLARYMLFVYPVFIALSTYASISLVKNYVTPKYQVSFYIFYFASIVTTALFSMDTGKFKDTYDMSYVRTVACVQKYVSWVEKQPWKSERILTNFPISQALEDKRNGYLSGPIIRYTVDENISTPYVAYFYLDGEQLPDYLNKFVKIRTFDDKHSHIIVMKNPTYVSSQNQ